MDNNFKIKLSQERRDKIFEQIKENSRDDLGFYLMTIFSALIVALGLLVNSVAVIIGGMLLAPLFNHTIGLGLSIIRGSVSKFKYHIYSLIKAILLSIGFTMLLFTFIPIYGDAGNEIIARGSPNIIHLFIALFSGAAGAFAIAWPGISVSIIGVLIASALIPPLATISYGFVSGDLSLSAGAFLLFFTNFIAIVFASILVFFVTGFRPYKHKTAQEFMIKDIKWSLILMLIVIIPLTYTFINANRENRNMNNVKDAIKKEIDGLSSNDIANLTMYKKANEYYISLTIFTDQKIDKYTKTDIENKLSYELKSKVNLELITVNTQKID